MMWSSLIIVIYIVHHSKADIQISECGDGKLTVDEKNKNQTLTCSSINTILNAWDIVLPNGTVLQFASCSYPDGCNLSCNTFDTQYFTAKRPHNNTSVLSITGNFRNIIAGKVRCVETGGGLLRGNVTCDVRVVYSAANLDGKVINNPSNIDWMLTGSLKVNKVFASDGQYNCKWTLDGSPDKEVNVNLTLAPFTDNGLQYYNATCSFAVPVTEVEGRYTGYSTDFEPGPGSSYSQNTVNIIKPTSSATLNNCSTSVEKGTNFTCTCQAAIADPPAIVTWGVKYPQHNHNQETITVTVQNSSNYTCRQYWGNTYNITVHTVNVTEPTTTIITTTVATKGPSASSSESATTPTTAAHTAPSASPSTGSSESVTTPTTAGQTAPSASPSTGASGVNDNKDITIGGVALPIVVGVAAGGGGLLIVVVIIIVVIVCVKRRRRSHGRSLILLSSTRSMEDFEEHMNSLYVPSNNCDDTQTEATAVNSRLPITTFNKSASNPRDNEEGETVSHDSSLYTSIDSAGYSLPSENAFPQGQVGVDSDEGLYSSADKDDDGGRRESAGTGDYSEVKLDPGDDAKVSDALILLGKNAAHYSAEPQQNNPVLTKTGDRNAAVNKQGVNKTGPPTIPKPQGDVNKARKPEEQTETAESNNVTDEDAVVRKPNPSMKKNIDSDNSPLKTNQGNTATTIPNPSGHPASSESSVAKAGLSLKGASSASQNNPAMPPSSSETGQNLKPGKRPTLTLKPPGVNTKPSDTAQPASRGTHSFNDGCENLDLEKEVMQPTAAGDEYNFLTFSKKASQAVANDEDSSPLYSHHGKT